MFVPHPREDGAEQAAAAHVRASLDGRAAANDALFRRRASLAAAVEEEAEEQAAAAAMASCAASCGVVPLTAALRRATTDADDQTWRRLTRQEKAAIVARARADGEAAMLERLQYRLERAGVALNGLRVTYDRLTVTRKARAAGKGLPSVVSPLRDAAAALVPAPLRGMGSSPSSSTSSTSTHRPPATVDALCDVSGVLRPATTTLLLGAPGAGKTTLLRALSGRLRASGAIVHVGMKLKRAKGGDDDDGNNNNSKQPHYWLRYNGAPAAPPSPSSSGLSPSSLAALAACGAKPPTTSSKPVSFEVPAVAAYVDQAELCAPALTVRETLEFAERCQGADAPSLDAVRAMLAWERDNEELVRAEGPPAPVDAALDAMLRAVAGLAPVEGQGKDDNTSAANANANAPAPTTTINPNRQERLIAEWTLRSLRLEHAADTPVGDAMLRGVSGGEKRRVALGEALVGPALFFALDEITTGLDSASALEVAKSLKRSARTFRVTVLCALLQPEPDVVAAFDDLLLLARGRVLYHGPVAGALPHFALLGGGGGGGGLRPKEGQDAAEFLVGLGAESDAEAARLSALFWASEAGAALRREAAGGGGGGDGNDNDAEAATTTTTTTTLTSLLPKRPHAPLSQVVRATFRRTYTLEVARNWEAFVVRAGLALLMAAVMGTLFLRLPATAQGGAAVLGVLVATLDFYAVLSIPTAQTTLLQMPLLFRQRDARYFPAWALLLPQQLVSMAALLMDMLCFALPLYFLVGFTAAAVPFFRYLVVAYCFALCLDALYRAFGALATSVPIAVSGMTVLFLLFNALAGLTIAASSIPVWWRWLYWLNPFAWALRALAVNELTQPRWQAPLAALTEGAPLDPSSSFAAAAPSTIGDGLLALYDMPRGPGSEAWIWAGAAVLFGEAMLFLALTWWGYARRTPPVPPVDVVIVAAAVSAGGAAEKEALDERKGGKGMASSPVAPPVLPVSVLSNGNDDADADDADDADDDDEASLMLPPVPVAFRDLCYYVPHPNPAAAAKAAAAQKEQQQQQQQPQSKGGLRWRGGGGKSANPTTPTPNPNHPELQLLRDVTGHFQPGRVAALMGASGAGKTTLLDVLALRKTTGRVTGDVAVGSRDPRRDRAAFRAVSGYCEQSSDLHVGLATVREAVVFSAALRLRDLGLDDGRRQKKKNNNNKTNNRHRRVEAAATAALAVVGLTPQSGVLVQALSSEQKKRLTIAVELAGRPSVLFLDEPTSGLDSGGAWAVGRALRAVAARGGTVVCTVHQPGDALFRYAFDDLLLLRRGGSVVYFGPLDDGAGSVGDNTRRSAGFLTAGGAAAAGDEAAGVLSTTTTTPSTTTHLASCSALAAYFETLEERVGSGTEVIPPLLPGQNPAAWVIGVVGASARSGGGNGGNNGAESTATSTPYPDLALAWRESEQARAARETAGQLLLPLSSSKGGAQETEAAAAATPSSPPSFWQQFRLLAARNLRAHWRHPARNLSRVIYALVAAALIGTIYFGRGALRSGAGVGGVVQTRDVLNAAGCYFLVVVAVCMESAYAAQEGIAIERPAYYRERAQGLYQPLPYLLAQIAAELPWCLLAVLLFVGVAYGLLGCTATASAFFYFVACGFLGVVAVYLVAQLLVHVSPALFVATIAMSVAATAQQALAGLYRTRPTSPPWFAWAYWVNPLWYTFAGLVGSQLGGETTLVVGDAALVVGGLGAGADGSLPPPPTVSEFVAVYFGVDAVGGSGGLTSPGACLGMLAVLCLGAATLSFAALRWLNFQNR